MSPLLRRGEGGDRPPLAGRLVGLGLGIVCLAVAVKLALQVVVELVHVAVPLLGIVGVYLLVSRGGRRR